MVSRKKKRAGVGAIGSCLAKFLHPSAHIRERYPNDYKTRRLDGLMVMSQREMTVSRSKKLCFIVTHDSIPDVQLHCTRRYLTITQEAEVQNYFIEEGDVLDAPAPENTGIEPTEMLSVDEIQRRDAEEIELFGDMMRQIEVFGGGDEEDIERLRAEGFEVVNDNEPLPENVDEAMMDEFVANDIFRDSESAAVPPPLQQQPTFTYNEEMYSNG